MRFPLINPIQTFLPFCFLFSFFGCHLSENEGSGNINFSPSVGRPLDQSVALKWIANYSKKNSRIRSYAISTKDFIRMVVNQPSAGISLSYGQDQNGVLTIMANGVDPSGKEIISDSIPTTSGYISRETYLELKSNFKGSVRSHFFGANTFKRLISRNSDIVLISLALNDKNEPQLLLSTPASTRNEELSYEDASSPCPPVCP